MNKNASSQQTCDQKEYQAANSTKKQSQTFKPPEKKKGGGGVGGEKVGEKKSLEIGRAHV